MARRIRWYIPFMSYNGTSCRVNIYDENYPEHSPQFQLPGADDPFFFEEDNSSDLLNDVVRYRTGYIRFVRRNEEEVAQLDDIYPKTPTERYVEVLYGNIVAFNGYIQQQDFSLQLIPNPRVIELPVISPLGVMGDTMADSLLYAIPTTISLGYALYRSMLGGYTSVIVPDIAGTELSQTIFSLVVEPWNEDFCHVREYGTPTNKQQPRSFIIEAICKAFGWICHDTPQALVFTSFDWSGNYASYPINHIGESSYKTVITTPATPVTLDSYYQLADDNAQQNTILPETGIKIEYKGESQDNIKFEFLRTYFFDVISVDDTRPYEQYWLCNLTPVPLLFETQNVIPATLVDEKIPAGTKSLVAWQEHVGVLWSVTTSSIHVDDVLFRLRFYKSRLTGSSYAVKFKCMYGHYFQMMQSDNEVMKFFYASIDIQNDYIEVSFRLSNTWTTEQLDNTDVVMFYDIELEQIVYDEPYARYRFAKPEEADYISADETSTKVPVVSTTIEMPISPYRRTDTMIGTQVRENKITTYRYMFQQRKEIKSKFRLQSFLDLYHARKFSYMNQYWRIIAQDFHLRDDEVTLTMESSPTLTV